MKKVLEMDSVPVLVAGMFYQAVVAFIRLYGSESRVHPPSSYKALEEFRVECACRLTGMRPRKVKEE